MDNTVNPAMSRLWDTTNTSANDKKSDLSALLQAKQQADMQAAAPKSSSKDGVETSEQGRVMASRMQQVEHAYQYSETMSLQLTTQEGDEVTLDFRQMYAEYQSYKEQQQGEVGPQGVRYFESREAMEMTAFEEQFAFSVEGDLNEAELAAVFDVFEQVDALANEFFEGDLEVALQKAMDLNIDYGQLQNMSLNLTQSTTEVTRYKQEAMAQYQQVQNDIEEAAQATQEGDANVADLPPYLQQWQSAIARLDEQFQEAQAMMDKLMSGVMEDRFPQSSESEERGGWFERVQAFHQQLADMAKANKEPAENETVAENSDAVEEAVEAGAEQAQQTPANPAENPNVAVTA